MSHLQPIQCVNMDTLFTFYLNENLKVRVKLFPQTQGNKAYTSQVSGNKVYQYVITNITNVNFTKITLKESLHYIKLL